MLSMMLVRKSSARGAPLKKPPSRVAFLFLDGRTVNLLRDRAGEAFKWNETRA
jgi:hypothetical protein